MSQGGLPPPVIQRVVATDAALARIDLLRRDHGRIFFYQSHGCCEGSMPMCFVEGEMGLNAGDVLLGSVAGDVPFYASVGQDEYLQGLQLTLDVMPGSAGTFSLEDGCGEHFVARLRLWTDAEAAQFAPRAPAQE
ncbi:MAG: hypothetical protein RLZZ584_991 [Pseudomonadota bacterium]|jgi:uncharacterized protein (DUF779 family)